MSPFAMQSLKPWNTFRLDASAHRITVVHSIEELCQNWRSSEQSGEPVLVLGEGSNVLFIADFTGHIIINRIKGIHVEISDKAWRLHVGAGENWHQLVEYTLAQGYAGLENLAMIPGNAGAAPIQNIGAYGVELEQVCEYVDVVYLTDGTKKRVPAAECEFGYRDSIFKHNHRDKCVITGIGLELNKAWQPVLTYGELTKLNASTVTPRQIYDTVCQIRRNKLPDPLITGNAGSFFKNPIITNQHAALLKTSYPTIPCFPQSTGEVKVAAGWLIEQCSLKELRCGGAAIHQQQKLILINAKNATGQDIVALARQIRHCVGETFDVWLEPEVRFIGPQGEVNAIEVLA